MARETEDFKMQYKYEKAFPYLERERKLSGAFELIFEEIEKNGNKLNEEKILQASKKK